MSSFRILLLCMCLMAVIVTAGCLENPSDSSVSPSSASATPSPTIQPTAIPVASVTTNQNSGTNPTPTVGSTSGSSGTGSTCAAGYTLGSDGNCYNYASDTNNCGSYGTVCASGKVCSAGACVSQGSSSSKSCAAGYTLGPDGNCYDYASDTNNCGSYGTVCAAGNVCSAGACVSGGSSTSSTCPAGYTLGPDENCYNYASDANNCGSYGTVCAAGNVCSAGTCVSGGSSTSKSCAAGYTLGPDGNCYDYASDNNNCGSYGTVCPSGDVCSASTCVSGGTTTTTTTPGVTITSIIHVIITPRLFLPTTTTATPTPTPTPTPIRTIVPVCHGSTCM